MHINKKIDYPYKAENEWFIRAALWVHCLVKIHICLTPPNVWIHCFSQRKTKKLLSLQILQFISCIYEYYVLNEKHSCNTCTPCNVLFPSLSQLNAAPKCTISICSHLQVFHVIKNPLILSIFFFYHNTNIKLYVSRETFIVIRAIHHAALVLQGAAEACCEALCSIQSGLINAW